MARLMFVSAPTERAQYVAAEARHALQGVEQHLFYDVVVAVGGDGTMLEAIKTHADNHNALFVGISAGHLGLLQAIENDELPVLAEALRTQAFQIIKAPLLAVVDTARPDTIIGYAFNDILVERQGPRAAKFHLKIDESRGTFIGDGVIFATTFGSTAYSLAAGGPIIDSDVQDVFIVTPNNPHISMLYSSLQRPHIFSQNRRIHIEMNPEDIVDRPMQLVLDGNIAIKNVTKPLTVFLSERTVNVLQLESNSMQNRIERKRLGRL